MIRVFMFLYCVCNLTCNLYRLTVLFNKLFFFNQFINQLVFYIRVISTWQKTVDKNIEGLKDYINEKLINQDANLKEIYLLEEFEKE